MVPTQPLEKAELKKDVRNPAQLTFIYKEILSTVKNNTTFFQLTLPNLAINTISKVNHFAEVHWSPWSLGQCFSSNSAAFIKSVWASTESSRSALPFSSLGPHSSSSLPLLPSSNLSAFSNICSLLVAWPHQRREGRYQEMGQPASASFPRMPWQRPSGITVWNTHYIKRPRGMQKANVSQFSSIFCNSGGRQLWLGKKDDYIFWALLESNTANSVSVACSLGHNSQPSKHGCWERSWTTSWIGTWIPPHWHKSVHLRTKSYTLMVSALEIKQTFTPE